MRYVASDHARAWGVAQSQYAITRERVNCLTETFVRPTRYLQRLVEQVAFLPNGGQRWTRTLQMHIPETALPSDRSWRIVSLGQYGRRRFPDFMATDASGARLNLLTRQQHGIALTRVTTLRHIDRLPEEYQTRLKEGTVRSIYSDFRLSLYNFFITAGDEADPRDAVRQITRKYRLLLRCIGIGPSAGRNNIRDLADDIAQAANATRYLCWVEAEPGEVINLQVSYTANDPLRQLGRGTFAKRLGTLWLGIAEPRPNRWKVWADWYRQLGLAPLNYEFSIPSHRHAGSYYFTIEPPSQTKVTYLDWGVGNSLEDGEIDCSTRSAHIHNDDDGVDGLSLNSGSIIRAYLHCSPQDHKLIVGTALLSCVFVVLVAIGRVPSKIGSPGQTILLAAPSVYIAYLARQQKHYFADAMRRQRGILWAYLATSVTFLVSFTFSNHNGRLGSHGLSWLMTLVSWAWGISSATVAAWYLPLGNSYERITESLTKRRIERVKGAEELIKIESPESLFLESRLIKSRALNAFPIVRAIFKLLRKRRLEILPAWKCYQRTVREYSSRIARLITFAALGMLAVTGSL